MARQTLKIKNAILVYQGGIANVFHVEDLNHGWRRRLMQSDFRSCESFARGLVAAGVKVTSCACNQAGDIAEAEWSHDISEAPFSDKFRPVFSGR